jgi:hypothetical protein
VSLLWGRYFEDKMAIASQAKTKETPPFILFLDMTKLFHPRRTRILPPSPIALSEKSRHQEKQNALAMRCRVVFDRLHPQLIDTHYNWYIAIDPESENYLVDPTLKGIQRFRLLCDIFFSLPLSYHRFQLLGCTL